MVLSRYFYREVILATLLISFSLVSVLALFRGSEILQGFASEGVDVIGFLLLVIVAIPELLELLLTVGFLVASLSVLQRLRAGKELLVVWFAGFTPMAILKPFLVLGLVVGLLVWGLSFYVAPAARSISDQILQDMLSDRWVSLIKPGKFITFTKGMMVYASSQEESGVLRGVVIEDARNEAEVASILIAEQAKLGQDDTHLLVELSQVSILRDGQWIEIESLQIPLQIDMWSYVGGTGRTRLYIDELYEVSFVSPENELTKLMQIDFYRRITRILMVMALAVISVSFLLLAPYTRKVSRYPVVLASVTALAMELGNLFLQKMALDGSPAAASGVLSWLYVLYLFPITVGLLLLWRASTPKKAKLIVTDNAKVLAQ